VTAEAREADAGPPMGSSELGVERLPRPPGPGLRPEKARCGASRAGVR
jgi:hypothetical protein